MFVAPQPSTPANRVILQWLEARSRFDIHAMDAQMARDFVSVALPAPAGKAEERGRDALWALTQSPAADLMSIEVRAVTICESTEGPDAARAVHGVRGGVDKNGSGGEWRAVRRGVDLYLYARYARGHGCNTEDQEDRAVRR
ncbi:hypothetical protein BV25DRAFT_1820134 [Artomyces pyxidatus]|uniref:Uncharacterized protein n=1 Tax=Artomyces pyxidatus TaxID=48021 RepID=A0ACB8TF00_9AGAM|nr:hypothetical protein BV25DRAFT_1820134 [Artomyces pyxidatus]